VLGVVRLVRDLADDAEVVQCVGEIRVKRAEAGLLQKRRLAEKPFGRLIVAGGSRLFRRIDDGTRFARFRHGLSDPEEGSEKLL
jgi:hypothetical protein